MFIVSTIVAPANAAIQFSEVNTDCPNTPEHCEFIEVVNRDCNEYLWWSKPRGAYIIGVSAWHKLGRGENEQYPVVRFLLDLSKATITQNQQYLTICGRDISCDIKFWNAAIYTNTSTDHRRIGHHRASYMDNGNDYPMVLFLLLGVDDMDSIKTNLAPYSPTTVTIQDRFDQHKVDLVKRNLRDVIVYGRRTPCQGCRWIEKIMNEVAPIRSDAVYASVSYVNREFDHDGFADLSLNKCNGSTSYVLASPTPGKENNCAKHATMLLQPTSKVHTWLMEHIARYTAKRKYAPVGEDEDCYITWFSLLYSSLRPADIAAKRTEIIESAESVSKRVKRSDTPDDDSCSVKSPDKKKLKPMLCSQDPNIAAKVKEACIVTVMRSVEGVTSYPPLTPCPSPDTPEGTLLPLSSFDDSEDVPTEPEDISDSMSAGTYSTADKLLSRSGFYNGNTHNLNQIKICRHHSILYGNGFKQYLMDKHRGVLRGKKNQQLIIKCVMPSIAGVDRHYTVRPVKNMLTINKQQSEAIFRLKGYLIPVGLPVCYYHFTAANNVLAEYTKLAHEATQEQTHTYAMRERSSICYTESSSQEGVPVICRADSGESMSSQEKCLVPPKETPIEKSRRLLRVFGNENLVYRWQYTDTYDTLSERSKKNYIRVYKAATKVLLNVLTGDSWKQFEADVMASSQKTWNEGDATISTILDEVNMLYNVVDSKECRYLLLGMVALNVPFRTLSEKVGGITHYTFAKSRALVRYYIHEKSPPPKAPKLRTVDRAKVEFFLTYVIDNSTPKPWGSKLRKLSCGSKVELPAFLSVIRPKKIITEFKSYAQQSLNPADHEKMVFKASSTYYSILKKLPIEYRKAATGLDYKTNKGLEAFDTLQAVLCDLNDLQLIEDDKLEQLKFDLNESKRYLRADYKYHVAETSTVADHDIKWALSDPSDHRLQSPTVQDHSNRCQRCELMKLLGNAIHMIVENADITPPKKKALMISDVINALADIEEMKYHKLRSVHQNSAKTTLLRDLGPNQAFITGDFAQKWLPTSGREDQTAYFGKKGITWHIYHAMMKDANGVYRYKIIEHFFMKQVPQDSGVVIACLNDTLLRLNNDFGVTEVFLRSDNAGSYHSAKTMAAVSSLNSGGPVKVQRWDFSEPQDG